MRCLSGSCGSELLPMQFQCKSETSSLPYTLLKMRRPLLLTCFAALLGVPSERQSLHSCSQGCPFLDRAATVVDASRCYPLLSVLVGSPVFSWKWNSWGLSTRSIVLLWHHPKQVGRMDSKEWQLLELSQISHLARPAPDSWLSLF